MTNRFYQILTIASPVLLVAAWYFVSERTDSLYFPPLREILIAFNDLWLFEHFLSDVVPSMVNMFSGYFLGCFLGIAVGLVLGKMKVLKQMAWPVISFWRALPSVALIPVFVAVMGFGNETRVTLIALASFFPVLITTIDGVRGTERGLYDFAETFHLKRWVVLTRIDFPGALPNIFAGMQTSLQLAFIVMVTSEMIGSTTGIGALTFLAQASYRIQDMWAGIVLLSILGFAINSGFELVRRRALRWHYLMSA